MRRLVFGWLRCRQYIYPDMRFPSCRCLRAVWHGGAHEDRHGDRWEGKHR